MIAATDPGGPNWLDTEGREASWRPSDGGANATPTVSARVVPTAELDLPAVDRTGRAPPARQSRRVAIPHVTSGS